MKLTGKDKLLIEMLTVLQNLGGSPTARIDARYHARRWQKKLQKLLLK